MSVNVYVRSLDVAPLDASALGPLFTLGVDHVRIWPGVLAGLRI